MNGSGHVREDFSAPPHLCPVDLAKLKAGLGQRCSLVARYHALLMYCESRHGFEAQARWLRKAIAVAETASSGVGKATVEDVSVVPRQKGSNAAAKRARSPTVEETGMVDESDELLPLAERLAARRARVS